MHMPVEPAAAVPYLTAEPDGSWSFSLAEDAVVYGLGEMPRGINKRGWHYALKYINRKKIEKAQLILITDDMSIKNVALNLAFEDYSYFNRLFKKITGITPQEYRTSYHS